MKPIRSLGICALATITLLALALAAQAVTILDPDNGEKNLYEIVAHPAFGSLTGFGDSSQKFAEFYPILTTLPANVTYKINAFAKFSSYNQDPGTYNSATVFLSESLAGFPIQNDGIFPANITFQATSPFGFVDRVNSGNPNLVYTNLALNEEGGMGLIFQISSTHWIVAFEDGGLSQDVGNFGDKDYNDLVLSVTAVPLPPSSLLLGSGLLGLAFWRRFRKS